MRSSSACSRCCARSSVCATAKSTRRSSSATRINARLESLRLRLQPHFLFNALNTISSTLYENPVAADELIGRLGELLRQSLGIGDRPEITLAEELDVLRAYQAFVDARFGDRVSFTYDVAPTRCRWRSGVRACSRSSRTASSTDCHPSSLMSRSRSARRCRRIGCGSSSRTPRRAERERRERIGVGLGATGARLQLLYGTAASIVTEDLGDIVSS